MMLKKIKSNITAFDNLFQGLYLTQPTLLSGKLKSGTSTLALRFLARIVQIGEKLLLFTDQTPNHVSLDVYGLGTDISEAIRTEQLSIVPYDRHLPLLPFPEALDELRDLITDRHYSYVIFDPAMPWLAAPSDQLDDRINSFFNLLSETSATSIIILRHPVSPIARRLFEEVSKRCPICLVATYPHGGPHALEVTKYMGEPPEKCPVVIQLTPGASADPTFLANQHRELNRQSIQEHSQRLYGVQPPYPRPTPLPNSPQAAGSSFSTPFPQLGQAPFGVPGVPSMPGVPSVPGVPSMPGVPGMPGIPSASAPQAMPAASAAPATPSADDPLGLAPLPLPAMPIGEAKSAAPSFTPPQPKRPQNPTMQPPSGYAPPQPARPAASAAPATPSADDPLGLAPLPLSIPIRTESAAPRRPEPTAPRRPGPAAPRRPDPAAPRRSEPPSAPPSSRTISLSLALQDDEDDDFRPGRPATAPAAPAPAAPAPSHEIRFADAPTGTDRPQDAPPIPQPQAPRSPLAPPPPPTPPPPPPPTPQAPAAPKPQQPPPPPPPSPELDASGHSIRFSDIIQ